MKVAVTAPQLAVAAMVLVTIYVPGVLVAKVIVPVVASIVNPADDENVPPTPPPLNVGVGLAPVVQYGLPA